MTPRSTVLIVVLTLILVGAAFADSSYPPPPNVRVTNIPQLNNEEQVFICPTDSNIIIANWRDFRLNYRQIGIGRSTDGGLTWTDSLISRPDMQYFGYDSKQSDPTMTVDRLGNFYMSALDYDGVPFSCLSTISFYKSTDKGISWTGPVPGMWTGDPNIFEDKQFMTVDRTGGPYDGHLYCSWTRFPNPDRIVLVRSIDGVASFEDTVVVGPTQTSSGCAPNVADAGQFCIPVVSSNGDVHVFWQGTALDSGDVCTGHMAMKHVVSTDGGASFTYQDTILQVSGYMTADGGINTYSQPAGDADITGGPFDGHIYISFTNTGPEDSGNSDVDFVRSTDNALTWSPRLQINDGANTEDIDSFHPWLIVNEEGVVIVIFYDQRYDAPSYYLFDALAAYSFDGGATFTSNHRISTVSSSPGSLKSDGEEQAYTIDENGFYQPLRTGDRAGLIGEYIGVTAFHDKINAFWTDSRDGNSEIYTANWYLPLLEPRLSAPEIGAYAGAYPSFHWATSWKHNEDRYRIEISTDESFVENVSSFVVDTNLYIPVAPLAEGSYYWRVKSLKTTSPDSSDYSEVWSFEADTTPPDAPVLLGPPDNEQTLDPTPTFQWTASFKLNSPVTYALYISTNPAFPGTPETRTYEGLTGTEYTPVDFLADGVPGYWKVIATDGALNSTPSAVGTVTYFNVMCGDIDRDGDPIITIADLVYLVDYMFGGGPEPPVMVTADANGSGGVIDVEDLVWIVDDMFSGGPPPVCR